MSFKVLQAHNHPTYFSIQIFKQLEKTETEREKTQIFCQWSQMSSVKQPINFCWMEKFQSNIFKLNKLVGLIFGNAEFRRPIRAEGLKKRAKIFHNPKNCVKMTATDIEEFTKDLGVL